MDRFAIRKGRYQAQSCLRWASVALPKRKLLHLDRRQSCSRLTRPFRAAFICNVFPGDADGCKRKGALESAPGFLSVNTSERGAVAVFAAGDVSPSGNGVVPMALQVLGNPIGEDLRCRAIFQVCG